MITVLPIELSFVIAGALGRDIFVDSGYTIRGRYFLMVLDRMVNLRPGTRFSVEKIGCLLVVSVVVVQLVHALLGFYLKETIWFVRGVALIRGFSGNTYAIGIVVLRIGHEYPQWDRSCLRFVSCSFAVLDVVSLVKGIGNGLLVFLVG